MAEYEYTDSDGNGMTDGELHAEYDAMLDEVWDTVTIGGLQYPTARVMREVDPIAYRCGFNDWLDFEIQDGRIHEV